MFINLIKVLEQKNITDHILAELLGLDEQILICKLAGKIKFTWKEVEIIATLCPKYNLYFLFTNNLN